MTFKCVLRECECNGCQNCLDTDVYIDAVCYDLAGEFLDFNGIGLGIRREENYE